MALVQQARLLYRKLCGVYVMKCPKCGSEMELHSYPDAAWCCPNPNCYHEEKVKP